MSAWTRLITISQPGKEPSPIISIKGHRGHQFDDGRRGLVFHARSDVDDTVNLPLNPAFHSEARSYPRRLDEGIEIQKRIRRMKNK